MRNFKRMMITGCAASVLLGAVGTFNLSAQLSRNAELAGLGPPRPGFLQSRISTGQGGRASQPAARLEQAMGCRFSARV